ncbi:MAG: DNA polymerase III subunit gamma/tau, partial [Candidatus Limnocylindrus sp.]
MTSYQVLARKWRPQTFADVAGQESVVRTLQRALDTGRVAHAFLFTGSRGIGKTTLARVLAKSLSCETGITSAPCGACTMCTEITEGKCVDVIEIDGASNTGVDDVRELREVARFLPQRGRFKVFIIDEVHMLSTGAFNALLKTLEEPPPHVKFIFATTEAHKIPVTILSRCQRYDFKRIPTKTIVERLRHVLQAEGIRIDDGGLTIIARAAEGGMRDALSLTDQVIAFAGEAVDADG